MRWAALCVPILWVATTQASTPGSESWLSSWAGEYVLDMDADAAQQRIGHSLDGATNGMAGLIRAKVRRKLDHWNRPVQRIQIRAELNTLIIELDDRAYAAVPDGFVETVDGPGGQPVELAHHMSDDVLSQRFRGPTQTRYHHLRRVDDGLVLEVRVQDGRTSDPVHYRLPYRKLP